MKLKITSVWKYGMKNKKNNNIKGLKRSNLAGSTC
jgi:hypothetical protein